jgi:cell division protein FtsW
MASAVGRRRLLTDNLLFQLTLALVVIGVVMVYDSSYVRSIDQKGDGFLFLRKQALYAFAGLGAMVCMIRYGYWKLRQLAVPLLMGSLVLLVAVYIPHVGLRLNGACRWIDLKFFQFQPSEFAKLVLIIYLAGLLARAVDGRAIDIRSFADGLLPPLLVVGLCVLLVEREPDLGTAAVMGLTAMTMFFLAGARKTHLAAICASGGVLMLLLSMMHGFRGDRLKTYLNPQADIRGKGYQTAHGILAVGSGGLRGIGFGAGREKYYLPEANTDFIFATIAEETGLIGSTVVVTLLFLTGWRGFVIARRTRDTFGAMLASGIAAMISWQAIINVGVVTGTIPATGVPLPFISFGGTSLILTLASVGILLNIAQHPEGRRVDVSSPRPAAESAPRRRVSG